MSDLTPMDAYHHARIFCAVMAAVFALCSAGCVYAFFWCETWKP